MKLPSKINILGHTYTVELKERQKEDGAASYGTIDFKQQKIWIEKNLNEQEQESSLIHEIIEAVNAYQNIGLRHHQIILLETGLYELIQSNLKIRR